ncbi:MAG: type IV toxin-antitoxin system AbiEi family antitoxin domain-containing protein [Desulfobacterales bacterium]|nr:type IV toxin-antitoxin system AbiEi family antitoxin domain-containing protein [Desulfobacterales bacterium]
MNSQKTSATIPKTGLAKRIRCWVSTRQSIFTVPEVCNGLRAKGKDRMQIRNVITDFVKRGEIQRIKKGRYQYNQGWRREKKGCLKPRIVKAMYVSASAFSSADIQRISGVSNTSYVNRIIRNLKKNGHIHLVGKRPCVHGRGATQLYNIVNREKFKIEVM